MKGRSNFGMAHSSLGVDEVGRGCLAGPLLVVAARQLGQLPRGLDDSKKLPKELREQLYPKLLLACQFGEGWVSPADIDRIGLTAATRLGVKRALYALKCGAAEPIIIDGNINYAPKKYRHVTAVVSADSKYKIVSAASVYAKVTRDRYMSQIAAKYPQYGFDHHVGYGTKLHLEMISSIGKISGFHRTSFAPLKKYLELSNEYI